MDNMRFICCLTVFILLGCKIAATDSSLVNKNSTAHLQIDSGKDILFFPKV